MLFTTVDRILNKLYRLDKNMAVGQMHEFPNEPWPASGIDKLIKRLTIQGVQTVLMVVLGLNH